MATEKCKRCGRQGTPWELRTEYAGHICYDCHIDLVELECRRKNIETDDKIVYITSRQ